MDTDVCVFCNATFDKLSLCATFPDDDDDDDDDDWVCRHRLVSLP